MHCRLDGLTSQARYVRVHVYRRAMHASGDSPWHSSAKHHILEACFFRMTPFRSMLLTLEQSRPVGTARDVAASGADVVALEELTAAAVPTYEKALAATYPYHAVRGHGRAVEQVPADRRAARRHQAGLDARDARHRDRAGRAGRGVRRPPAVRAGEAGGRASPPASATRAPTRWARPSPTSR